jgi:RimJ/RimL family protein N-acetyltransferase
LDIATSTVRLRTTDREALLAHFLTLNPEDRRLRFGSQAADQLLEEYVERIDFARDCLFAVQDEKLRLVAVVHVATRDGAAELGMSVLAGWRGHGLGNALLQRAVVWLRNRGILSAHVHCLAENAAMMHLARKNGMRIAYDGSETDGRLELDAPTADSYVSEWVEEQRGLAVRALRQNARWMQLLLGKA